ncbi:MAG TPA: thiamine pyrophosphate-binding protein [bacterium]|nr:thiamine pyrophosphate-binding protein [bacterium]
MPTNAEAIAATLAEAGIETAFGLPGGEITVLLDACRKHGIRFFLTGHEASAAFMADVTGQITGRPGVCLATLGPGAVNLSLGVANAFLERSPVLAITAQLSTVLEDHFPHQRLPLDRFFGTIAKGSTILNGRGTDDAVRSAIALATSEPHGPVHLGLPSNLAGVEMQPGQARPARSRGPARGVALEEVAAAVGAAKRPLLMVGLGARPHDAPALRSFADRTHLPFVVTPKAKGILPEDAPGFLGVVSGMAADHAVLETLDEADLLLGVGFDPVECDKDWYAKRPVASLSRASTAEGAYRPLEAIGDIAEMLPEVAAQVRAAPWPDDLVAACRARVRPEPAPAGHGLSPIACVRAMRKVAPHDAVLACDVGSHKYFAGQFWESYEPHTFFMSNGLSAMGYGIPAAIAAKLQFPARPVMALIGDGGFLMMLHNLTLLAQHKLPIVIICFVDDSLSLIRVGQKRRGFAPHGVDFAAPDFAAIAEGFGVSGTRVTSVDHLARALEEAILADRPAVLSVGIDAHEYDLYC